MSYCFHIFGETEHLSVTAVKCVYKRLKFCELPTILFLVSKMLIIQITARTHQLFTKELTVYVWGTQWSSRLRHSWFDSRGVNWNFFFQLFNPSDLTMAVGSTQPLTQMRTRIRLQLKYDGTRGRRERKWGRNRRLEWGACILHTTSEHGVSSITTVDAHTSGASSRLNWRLRRFKWTRPFRR
jgi:hypothetical protein